MPERKVLSYGMQKEEEWDEVDIPSGDTAEEAPPPPPLPRVASIDGAETVQVNGGVFHAIGRDNIVYNITQITPSDAETLLTKILNWLPRNNYRATQMDNFDKRTSGTGSWFTDSAAYQNWKKGSRGILWGRGIPGAGKTILASIVINDLEELAQEFPEEISVVFAYCRHPDPTPVRSILVAFVRQLLTRDPALAEVVEPLYALHQRENTQPSQPQLVKLLEDISMRFKTHYYVLDALDELPPEAQFALLEALSSLKGNLFIASRPLSQLETVVPRAVFINISAHARDIGLLVSQNIDGVAGIRGLLNKEGDKERIIAKIKQNSRGMFLHAALQVESLRDCVNTKSLFDKLEKLPKKIEDLYTNTVRRIEQQSEEQVELARTILAWLLCACKSVSVKDLQYALATSPNSESAVIGESALVDEKMIVSVCCGLVTVDSTSDTVRLIHHTAKDALKTVLTASVPKPHALFATTCIKRLSLCGVHESSMTTEEELNKLLNLHPLLKYAYEFWGYHVREAKMATDASVIQFVKQCQSYPHLRFKELGWQELHSLSPLHVVAQHNLPDLLEHVIEEAPVGKKPRLWNLKRIRNTSTVAVGVNAQTSQGVTALMLASAEGHEEIVKRFLEINGIKVNTADVLGLTALMLAAEYGHTDVVQHLLAHSSIDVNAADKNGWTALMLASEQGHEGIVKRLVASSGIDVNAAEGFGWTALILASAQGHEEIVKYLLAVPKIRVNATEKGTWTALMLAANQGHEAIATLLLNHPTIKINSSNKNGWTAMMYAANKGSEEIVKRLVEDFGSNGRLKAKTAKDGSTALMMASRRGHVGIVKLLLEVPKANVNAANANGRTPLMMASSHGHPEVVQTLLSVPKIDANLKDKNNRTALMHASEKGQDEVVKLLLAVPNIEINVGDAHGVTALGLASTEGHEEVVRLLLAVPDIEVNTVDDSGMTALMRAAEAGYEGVVKQMITFPGIQFTSDSENNPRESTFLMLAMSRGHEKIIKLVLDVPGVEVNTGDRDGSTALMYGALNGHGAAVAQLLAHPDIDVNSKHKLGFTALMMASFNGHGSIVKRLLEVPGVEANVSNENGWTALMYAACRGHQSIVKDLLGCPGIHVNSVDETGRTALMMASFHGYEIVVRELLSRSLGTQVNVNMSNQEGLTALMWASKKGHEGVVKLLLGYSGTEVNKIDREDAWTALIYAARYGHVPVVKLLLEVPGIEVEMGDKDGWTAVMYAYKFGHDEVLELLKHPLGTPLSSTPAPFDEAGAKLSKDELESLYNTNNNPEEVT